MRAGKDETSKIDYEGERHRFWFLAGLKSSFRSMYLGRDGEIQSWLVVPVHRSLIFLTNTASHCCLSVFVGVQISSSMGWYRLNWSWGAYIGECTTAHLPRQSNLKSWDY